MGKEDILLPLDSGFLNECAADDSEHKNIEAAEEIKEIINNTFSDFGIQARVKDYIIGHAFTRYNLESAQNCSVRTLSNLICDIQVRLGGMSVRYDINSPGSYSPGLEVENAVNTTVSLKEVYDKLPTAKEHPLAIPLGKKVNGDVVWVDLPGTPHILLGGTTGSGKSIFINSMITTLMMRNAPDQLRFVLFDPKHVELNRYKEEPHLLCPIVHTAEEAKRVLNKLVEEMEDRYAKFSDTNCCNITEYNEDAAQNAVEKLPYIIAIIDEYADLVDSDKTIAIPVISLIQKARASGIHLVIATQRPSPNVISGVLKANMPVHIALMMATIVDSMTLIGEGGAEKLVGRGDMLVQSPLVSRIGLVRLQGSFAHRTEIKQVVDFFKEHYETKYDSKFLFDNEVESKPKEQPVVMEQDLEDERYLAIKEWVMTQEYMSISRIQRECSVGFNRAGRYFLRLQQEGVISVETTKHGCPVIKKEDK